ncbi:hypothetical protein L1987_01753 [Smallanthus sonchifolius]|uniref:Uncharacterized protein n=1 Tax=Smallanthus sonchifolius TaxID=185202 RepID=A0ACB9K5X7_9ASTR|nr:hypothetical protein L1987_01753 [Smallanthus sonchifolius]
MSRFKYNVKDAAAGKVVRRRAPATILPQYNEEYTHNTVSLHLFPLRMYELAQMRCLTPEDIIALASMTIEYEHVFEFYAKDFANVLDRLSKDVRGNPYEE